MQDFLPQHARLVPANHSARSVSVVVPVHNEAGTIAAFVEDLYVSCLNGLTDCELILVEDGSTDGTRELLRQLAAKHRNISLILGDRKLGYGPAAIRGLQNATKEWSLLMDGDGQIEARDMWLLINSPEDYDIVLAEKFPRCDSTFRILLSRVFDVLTDLVLGVSIRDINFGFRIMRGHIAREVADKCGKLGNIFNAELAIRCVYAGYRIDQVRVRHRNRLLGKSKGVPPSKVLVTVWRAFKGLFELRKELTR